MCGVGAAAVQQLETENVFRSDTPAGGSVCQGYHSFCAWPFQTNSQFAVDKNVENIQYVCQLLYPLSRYVQPSFSLSHHSIKLSMDITCTCDTHHRVPTATAAWYRDTHA